MRRKEREVTDLNQINAVLTECDCCRIALSGGAGAAPYIVPLSFGWERAPQGLCLYFHGARQGRKLRLMDQNPQVGFEMDAAHQIIRGELACDYTTHYHSIIGSGRLERLSGYADKLHALTCIMEHYEPGRTWTFHEKIVQATQILRLTVEELSCKAYK